MREWLMSFPRASRSCASPSQLLDNNEPQTTNATCGPPPSSAFAWYDRDTASLRMSQGSLPGMDTSAPSSETWPRAGTMLDGECYQQPKWERRICEIGSGFLPTPQTSNGLFATIVRPVVWMVGRWTITSNKGVLGTASLADLAWHLDGKPLNPEFHLAVMMWPSGWTDSKPLATDKFQSWRQQHGGF